MKNYGRVIATTVLLIWIMCFLLPAQAKNATKLFNEDIRWSFQALPPRVDNLDWRSLDRWYIIRHVFDTILTYDSNLNLTSGVASKWKISADRLTYTFTIRENLKFSNGRSINARDVVYSLKRYLISQNNDDILKQHIKDAKSLNQIKDDCKGVKQLSKYQFEITLNSPMESLLTLLTQADIASVVDQSTIDDDSLKMTSNVVSSGPFIVTEISNERILLTQNPYYRDNQPDGAKSVGLYKHNSPQQAMDWFTAGKTNFYAILDPFQGDMAEKILHKKNIAYPFHRVGFLYLNINNKHLKSIKLRKQIYLTMSEKNIAKKYPNPLLVWNNSLFPPGTPGYVSSISNKHDISSTQDAPRISLNIMMEKGIPTKKIEAIIKERMSLIGIDVKFIYHTKINMVKKFTSGEFDIVITSVGFPMEDRGLGVYFYFLSNPPYIYEPTGKTALLFKEYVETYDEKERADLLKQIANSIEDQYYFIPIYHTGIRYIVSDELEIANPEKYRTGILLSRLRLKHETKTSK